MIYITRFTFTANRFSKDVSRPQTFADKMMIYSMLTNGHIYTGSWHKPSSGMLSHLVMDQTDLRKKKARETDV